jgi:hypothetical protein
MTRRLFPIRAKPNAVERIEEGRLPKLKGESKFDLILHDQYTWY